MKRGTFDQTDLLYLTADRIRTCVTEDIFQFVTVLSSMRRRDWYVTVCGIYESAV